MRRIHVKNYSAWDPKTKRKLRRNNLGEYGLMREALYQDPLTFVMLDEDELIGWSILINDYNFYIKHPLFGMFFVKKRYRRQGVGTALGMRMYRHGRFGHTDQDCPSFFRQLKRQWQTTKTQNA